MVSERRLFGSLYFLLVTRTCVRLRASVHFFSAISRLRWARDLEEVLGASHTGSHIVATSPPGARLWRCHVCPLVCFLICQKPHMSGAPAPPPESGLSDH